jgi:hypothetical protein
MKNIYFCRKSSTAAAAVASEQATAKHSFELMQLNKRKYGSMLL